MITPSVLELCFSQLVHGLMLGMLLGIITVGLTMIFGLMDIVNVAHGAIYALGAYMALTLMPHISFWATLIIVPLLMIGLGMCTERYVLRMIYGGPIIMSLLLTFGIMLVITGAIRMIWGVAYQPLLPPPEMRGYIVIGPLTLPVYRVFVLAITIGLFVGTYLLLTKTRIGLAIRAGMEHPEMVRALGINLDRIRMLVVGIGFGLAGLGGILAGPLWVVYPEMGAEVIATVFTLVVIGGMGSLMGSLVAGIIAGEAIALTSIISSELSYVVIYLLLIGFLVVKPTGIGGRI